MRFLLLFVVTLAALGPAPLAKDAPRKEPPAVSLPETPSRHDVSAAMDAISPAVRACGRGEHGSVPVRLRAPEGSRHARCPACARAIAPRPIE